MTQFSGDISIRPAIVAPWTSVVAAMSTRNGGSSSAPFGVNLSYAVGDERANVDANRTRFFGSLGVRLGELAVPRQVHSAVVRVVDTPGTYVDCDALVTSVPRVFLCVTVADCVPILLVDPARHVAAAVHAGWRGTAAAIVRETVRTMVEVFGINPAHLVAFLGPSAGPCCYQVGEEVARHFDIRHIKNTGGSSFIDLKGANTAQMMELGIAPERIEVHPACTICGGERYHSYRRDKDRSGRMLACVGFSS